MALATFILLVVLIIILNLIMLGTITAMVLTLIASLFSEVPFVPLGQKIVDEALTLLDPKNTGTFYDLGFGDGRVVFTYAARFPNAKAIGYEIGPLPFIIGTVKNFLKKLPNAHLKYGNFFKKKFADADYIYLYLFPGINQRLQKKFSTELKKGARVVVCDFPFYEMTPMQTKTVIGGLGVHTLYLYEF